MEIKVRDLHKSFDGQHVLRGLSLDIRSGEIAVIVGGSGSGKSVLLKHLIGLLKPDSGEIWIDDENIVRMRERELSAVRRRIGMIFQSGGLLQSYSLGYNVGLALSEHGLATPEEIRGIVGEKLSLVGLGGMEDKMPSTLSGGMRKRAAIARALTLDADALFYDEPTAGLDPPMSQTVDDLIVEMKEKTGCTSVVVTHDLVSVFSIADSIHMLYQGEIVFSGTREEMLNCDDERVRDFLGRGRLEGGGLKPLPGGAGTSAAASKPASSSSDSSG